MRVGVLISGRGSNMESLAGSCADPSFPASIALVASDKPDAPGLDRARELGLATAAVDPREFADRAAFETAMVDALRLHEVELVCLAGFMRLLGPTLLDAFPGRVLNIHPSLLPAFPGLHAQRQALEHGVRYAGCTVHLVTEEMDAGPILLQAVVSVEPDDDEEKLAARILEHEHCIYPEALRLIASGRVEVVGRTTRLR